MINGVNPNGDITQKQAKMSIGVYPTNQWNGKNYANRINNLAKNRLAAFRQSIRRLDSLQATNRYKWSNLPTGLRSNLIERVLYYRGQGMFFWDDTLDKYFYLPYSLTSEDGDAIDFYGQYQLVKPNSFNGKAETDKKSNGKLTKQEVYLGTITRIPVYDIEELEAYIKEHGEEWCKKNLCILSSDYTYGLSQYNVPMSILQETWIGAQAETPLFLRTAILKALTPKLLKTADQGTMDSVLAEIQSIEDSILEGKTIIPVTSFQDIQDIESTSNVTTIIESILKVYESYDNIRKSQLGINNNGAFKKTAQILQAEQDTNQISTDYIKTDGLLNRTIMTELVNRLFGLQILVEDTEATEKEKVEEETDKIEEEELTND